MLSRLRTIFDDAVTQVGTSPGSAECEHAIRLAAAALLVEMSRADHEVSPHEEAHIRRALLEVFDLPPDEVEALVDAGVSRADAATSLYEFTSIVNERFDHDQKVHLVELMWRIAYADGELEKHEAHLVRRVADLLHLRHREYISGKLRAEQESRGG
jgi:uncharacterized tellurite resistance protein B-like protein